MDVISLRKQTDAKKKFKKIIALAESQFVRPGYIKLACAEATIRKIDTKSAIFPSIPGLAAEAVIRMRSGGRRNKYGGASPS